MTDADIKEVIDICSKMMSLYGDRVLIVETKAGKQEEPAEGVVVAGEGFKPGQRVMFQHMGYPMMVGRYKCHLGRTACVVAVLK